MAFTYDPVGGAVAAGGGSWDLLSHQVAVSVASLEFEDLLTDTYDTYKLVINNADWGRLQLGNGSTYVQSSYRFEATKSGVSVLNTSANGMFLANSTSDLCKGEVLIFNSRIVGLTYVNFQGNVGTLASDGSMSGRSGLTDTYSSIRINAGTGDNDFTASLLGLKKA